MLQYIPSVINLWKMNLDHQSWIFVVSVQFSNLNIQVLQHFVPLTSHFLDGAYHYPFCFVV